MHQSIDKKNKIAIYLILLLILSTISSKNINSQKSLASGISNLNVEGLSYSNNLLIANKLDSLLYKNIFLIDKNEINRIILTNNIIEEYKIKKVYPSQLDISIKPTKFIAKIYDDNKLLIGSNGRLISVEKINIELPYLKGKFNSREFLKFKENVYRSNFNFKEFKYIYFYPSKRWDVLTVNDILIKLPKDNLLQFLNFAHNVVNNEQFKNHKIIDLRASKNLIVK